MPNNCPPSDFSADEDDDFQPPASFVMSHAGENPPRLALFDLDFTLLPIDSDHSWGEFAVRIGWCDPVAHRARNDAFFADYQAGRLDIAEYVRFALAAVIERGPGAAAAAREQFLREVITPAIQPAALERVRAHQAAGDTVVITTATNEFVTRPIAHLFGVQHLIATQLAVDEHGWYNGEIAGTPNMREGKVTRLQQWMAAQGWDWGSVHTTFYSDSMNDVPLLERVDVPIATNPSAALRTLASQRGWQILDFWENTI